MRILVFQRCALIIFLIGAVCTKKNDERTGVDLQTPNAEDVENSPEEKLTKKPEEEITRTERISKPEEEITRTEHISQRKKGSHLIKQTTTLNSDYSETTETTSDDKVTEIEKATETIPTTVFKNKANFNRRNKTKPDKVLLTERDRSEGQKEEILELTTDNLSVTTTRNHLIPPFNVRDRSVGIPDHVESEYPQKNFNGTSSKKIHRPERIKNRLHTSPETANELFPVEKNDQAAVKLPTVSAKKRFTTRKPTEEPTTTAFFYILTGIPPEDLDFRNPVTKPPKGGSIPNERPIPTESPQEENPETPSDGEFTSDDFQTTPPPRSELINNKRKTTVSSPNEDPSNPKFHILTGIPDDVTKFHVLTGIPPVDATEPEGEEETEEKDNTQPTDKEENTTGGGFHILTGIPSDETNPETGEEKKITKQPTIPTKSKKTDEKPADESEDEDFSDEPESTTVITTQSSSTSTTPTTTTRRETTSTVTSPVTTKVSLNQGRGESQQKRRTKKPDEEDESKLVATDADFGKAVNSKFNEIIRNLSATGVLTEKDLLSERVIKNISDSFAEFVQQSLINRDSSEPLGKFEQDLILEENSEKVINQFKASRSTKLRMEKRHGSVIDLGDSLAHSTSEFNPGLETTHSDEKVSKETTKASSTLITSSSAATNNSQGRNKTKINILPVLPTETRIRDSSKSSQTGESSREQYSEVTTSGSRSRISSTQSSEQKSLRTGSAEEIDYSDEPRGGSSEVTQSDILNKFYNNSALKSSTGSFSSAASSAQIKLSTVSSVSKEFSSELSKGSTTLIKTSQTSSSSLSRHSSEDKSAPEVSTERGSEKPEFFAKKQQTPVVRFQLGANNSTLKSLNIHENIPLFPLEEPKNNTDIKFNVVTVAEGQSKIEDLVGTHVITRGPLTLPSKIQERKEPNFSGDDSSQELTTTVGSSQQNFPDPPNWSAGGEKESFFGNYRTKPIPDGESREKTDVNISESNNTSEVSESTRSANINSGSTSPVSGLIFLSPNISNEEKSSGQQQTTSPQLIFGNIFQNSSLESTALGKHSSPQRSTINFGITYGIEIIENSTAPEITESNEFNLNISSVSGTSSSSSYLTSSLASIISISSSTNLSDINKTVSGFETTQVSASETTLKNNNNNTVSFNTSALSVSALSTSSGKSETSQLWTQVDLNVSTTTASSTLSGSSQSSLSSQSSQSQFEIVSSISGETKPTTQISIANNSNIPIPEPEWTKSSQGTNAQNTSEVTGGAEPEWTKSTYKISSNESSSGLESGEVTKVVDVVVNPSVSSETTVLTTHIKPTNVAIATWSFKFMDLEWDTSLNDKSSWQYRQLSDKVEPELTKIFKQLLKEKFVGLIIKRFSAGSVVVNGQIELTEKVDSAQLEDSFRTYMREQSFAISGDQVDPASIKIESLGDTAPQTAAKPIASSAGGVPGYVIGIIVAVIILALVIVAVALYLRRYRNRHSHEGDYPPNVDPNSGVKNWQQQQMPPRTGANDRDQYAGVNMYEMNDAPGHTHINRGYQSDTRTNGYNNSGPTPAETQSSVDETAIKFEDEMSSRH